MTTFRSSRLSPGLRRLAVVAVIMAAAGLLQGCGTNRDNMSTGAIPDDYRTRHPITLAEVEHSIDIPIGSGDNRLTTGTRDAIHGFLSDYRTRSSGNLEIQFPQGSMNEAGVARIHRELRALLAQAGIPGPRIIETTYRAGGEADAAPVRLTFVAVSAMTDQCGQWPEDIANNTMDNKNWHNFGCASQNNLAAQIANPMDLVAPRGMSPIDAKRRTTVIELYREGKSTTSE